MSIIQPSITQPSEAVAAETPFAARPLLSRREREVLLAWLLSDSKDEVGAALHLSIGTINTYLTRVRGKYAAVGRSATTKSALLARALQDGLLDLHSL